MSWLRAAACFALAAAMAGEALAQSGPRSGLQPCRQGVLAIIAMLNDGDDRSADYRHAYSGVVASCGGKSVGSPGGGFGGDRKACPALALKMLDEIEEGRFKAASFAKARDAFAAHCVPR